MRFVLSILLFATLAGCASSPSWTTAERARMGDLGCGPEISVEPTEIRPGQPMTITVRETPCGDDFGLGQLLPPFCRPVGAVTRGGMSWVLANGTAGNWTEPEICAFIAAANRGPSSVTAVWNATLVNDRGWVRDAAPGDYRIVVGERYVDVRVLSDVAAGKPCMTVTLDADATQIRAGEWLTVEGRWENCGGTSLVYPGGCMAAPSLRGLEPLVLGNGAATFPPMCAAEIHQALELPPAAYATYIWTWNGSVINDRGETVVPPPGLYEIAWSFGGAERRVTIRLLE